MKGRKRTGKRDGCIREKLSLPLPPSAVDRDERKKEDRKKRWVHQRKALPLPPSISSGSCFGAMPELWLGMGGVEGFPGGSDSKESACNAGGSLQHC